MAIYFQTPVINPVIKNIPEAMMAIFSAIVGINYKIVV
jgi:hypothetical protein